MFPQPVAYRLVIELQTCPCYAQAHNESGDTDENMGADRRIHVILGPAHVHVHNGIMGDVEGEGELSDNSADTGGTMPLQAAASANREDEGKEQQDGTKLVDTLVKWADVGEHRSSNHGNDKERCGPEATFDRDKMIDAREQQPHGEWEHQAHHGTIDVLRIEDEAAIDGVFVTFVHQIAPQIELQAQIGR